MSIATNTESTIAWLPDLLYTGGRFERGLALVCDAAVAECARVLPATSRAGVTVPVSNSLHHGASSSYDLI
jgi:hypothetical protein